MANKYQPPPDDVRWLISWEHSRGLKKTIGITAHTAKEAHTAAVKAGYGCPAFHVCDFEMIRPGRET